MDLTTRKNIEAMAQGSPPKGVDWVGIRYVCERQWGASVKDSVIEYQNRHESLGVYIEVLVRGQFAYAATSNLSEGGLKLALDRAIRSADMGSAHALYSFSKDVRPPSQDAFRTKVLKPVSEISIRDVFERMREMTDRMKVSSKIVRRLSKVLYVDLDCYFVSSNGASIDQQFALMSSSLEAIAQDGPVVQRRTDSGGHARSRQGGLEFWWDAELDQRVKKIAEEAVELTSAEQCPTGVMDLLLMPDQMMLQIHESIGHPLEIDRILGDERNYAGWSFVKKEDFGQLQYGSSLMNVTFDPRVENEFASYAYDDSGAPAQREYLIRDGRLLRGLGGLESQKRSGLQGVSNARASLWNRPPIDRMANLNLEPGSTRLEDMISAIENGVLMESNRSWSIDDFRNKFQFGCEYAKKIESGKITKTLRNPNYRGITVPFWTSLKSVGDSSTLSCYGTPYCGKGEPNQAIRVGHASPPCVFGNVEVFGGVGE